MQRHWELEECRALQLEQAAAIVAHTVAVFAGKSLKEGTNLVVGDFMPSQQSKLKKAKQDASRQALRDFLHGLAKDKGLA